MVVQVIRKVTAKELQAIIVEKPLYRMKLNLEIIKVKTMEECENDKDYWN